MQSFDHIRTDYYPWLRLPRPLDAAKAKLLATSQHSQHHAHCPILFHNVAWNWPFRFVSSSSSKRCCLAHNKMADPLQPSHVRLRETAKSRTTSEETILLCGVEKTVTCKQHSNNNKKDEEEAQRKNRQQLTQAETKRKPAEIKNVQNRRRRNTTFSYTHTAEKSSK